MSQTTGEDLAWLREEKILDAAGPNIDFCLNKAEVRHVKGKSGKNENNE